MSGQWNIVDTGYTFEILKTVLSRIKYGTSGHPRYASENN